MIYLQGNIYDPSTWYTTVGTGPSFKPFKEFNTTKDARIWVIKELRRRVAEINKVKHEWMHPRDKNISKEIDIRENERKGTL